MVPKRDLAGMAILRWHELLELVGRELVWGLHCRLLELMNGWGLWRRLRVELELGCLLLIWLVWEPR